MRGRLSLYPLYPAEEVLFFFLEPVVPVVSTLARTSQPHEAEFVLSRLRTRTRDCAFLTNDIYRTSEFYDYERIRAMGSLVQHYTGHSSLDKGTLLQLVRKLPREQSYITTTPSDGAQENPTDEGSSDDDQSQIDDGKGNHLDFEESFAAAHNEFRSLHWPIFS